MDYSIVFPFVLASLVIILAPGADVFLLLRSTLASGVRAGLRTLVGLHLGNVVQSLVMVSGVGLALAAEPAAMGVLKILGSCYLLYLAFHALKAGTRQLQCLPGASVAESRPHDEEVTAVTVAGGSGNGAFRMGLVTNLTNPKVGLFFLTFFPQFIGKATAPTRQLVLLSAIFIAIAVVWEVIIVLAAGRLKRVIRSPKVAIAMDYVCGTAFILIAISIFLI